MQLHLSAQREFQTYNSNIIEVEFIKQEKYVKYGTGMLCLTCSAYSSTREHMISDDAANLDRRTASGTLLKVVARIVHMAATTCGRFTRYHPACELCE